MKPVGVNDKTKRKKNMIDLSEVIEVLLPVANHQDSRAARCNPQWRHFLSNHLCSNCREKRGDLIKLSQTIFQSLKSGFYEQF